LTARAKGSKVSDLGKENHGRRRDRGNGVALRNTKERGAEGKEGVLSVGERGKVTFANIQKFEFSILLLNGEKSPKHHGEMIAFMRQCKPDIPTSLIVPKGTNFCTATTLSFSIKPSWTS